MSKALGTACTALHINGRTHDRETVATRIIARSGVLDAKALSNRVVAETRAMQTL